MDRSATPALRELALRLHDLNANGRREARAVLARPTDGSEDRLGDGYEVGRAKRQVCRRLVAPQGGRRICVHWVTRTADKPPLGSGPERRRRLPKQVKLTLAAVTDTWNHEIVTLGYRPPSHDRGRRRGEGPNRGMDLYLADIGAEGLMGYCTTDPGERRTGAPVHAYCVLDDDFSAAQFSDVSGTEALQVTVAHEFFHAVQFGYEFSKGDAWLREGTAAWIEDEVFDWANANYQYLKDSPLHQPEIPLDGFQDAEDGEDFEYGTWVFWRFLGEYYGTPTVIRRVIEAAAPVGDQNPTALQAVRTTVAELQPDPARCVVICSPSGFGDVFAEFGIWAALVKLPAALYEEGQAYLDEELGTPPPEDADLVLDPSTPDTFWRQISIDHLATRVVIFQVLGTEDLRVAVDGPPDGHEPQASVVGFADGEAKVSASIALDDQGDGSVDVIGGVPEAAVVYLFLGNASTSFDGDRYRYRATLLP